MVDSDKILLPPLQSKVGLIKQFTKALDKHGKCFEYMCVVFPSLTEEKLKAGIFDVPQIRQLINNKGFENSKTDVKRTAWNAFVDVVRNFFGNTKTQI